MFVYCDINSRDVARLEISITKTRAAIGEFFLAFRKSNNIPSAYITVYNYVEKNCVSFIK